MKLSDLKTNEQLIEEQLAADPEFRAEWERTALARAVALQVLRYRNDRGLSQREFADLLGMKQPQVARLERGDVNPTLDTLVRIVPVLDIELTIDIVPSQREPKLVTKRARTVDAVASYEASEEAQVLVAALA
jgi:transcriptional regulator with XRE-family HTH domain